MKPRNPPYCRAAQTTPRWDLLVNNSVVAFDAEFQRVVNIFGAQKARLGRVSAVDANGAVILATLVAYDNETGLSKEMDGSSQVWSSSSRSPIREWRKIRQRG